MRRGHAADLTRWRRGELRVLPRNLVKQVTGHGEMHKYLRQSARREVAYLRIRARSYFILEQLRHALMILQLHPQVLDIEFGTAQAKKRIMDVAVFGIKLVGRGNSIFFRQLAKGIVRLGVVSNHMPRKLPHRIAAGFLFGKDRKSTRLNSSH